jgi:hypothetical protein
VAKAFMTFGNLFQENGVIFIFLHFGKTILQKKIKHQKNKK